MLAPDTWHHSTCTNRDDVNHWPGRMGDVMTTCRACRRVTSKVEWEEAMAAAAIAAGMTPPAPTPGPEPATLARYVVACAACGIDVPEYRPRPVRRYCRDCAPAAPRKDNDDDLLTRGRRYRRP